MNLLGHGNDGNRSVVARRYTIPDIKCLDDSNAGTRN